MADRSNVTDHVASAFGRGECVAATRLDQPDHLGSVVPTEAGGEPRVQRGRVGRVRGRAAGERDPTPRDGAQKAEEASVVLQGADVRARETFPPAEIPERTREGAFGLDYTADPHPGEDLVPESQVQDEESGD